MPKRPARDDVTEVELFGGVEKRELVIVDYDPTWPQRYGEHEGRIRAALGPVARQVEHIGSTSVPGLGAKPIIDILVTVDDITDESAYLPGLLDAGYVLRVREPGHRLVRTPNLDTHVHILQTDDEAADDYLLLRDHLRADAGDRGLYERTKRRLVAQDWADMNAYADAKTEVITRIKQRARERRAATGGSATSSTEPKPAFRADLSWRDESPAGAASRPQRAQPADPRVPAGTHR